jgi:hypothetical protein
LSVQEAYYIHYTGIVLKPWDATREEVETKAQDIKDPVDRKAWVSLYTTYWEESAVCEQPT